MLTALNFLIMHRTTHTCSSPSASASCGPWTWSRGPGCAAVAVSRPRRSLSSWTCLQLIELGQLIITIENKHIYLLYVLTVVSSIRSLAILAAGREQRFRPLHRARALRGDFEGRREHSLNEEIISSLGLLSHDSRRTCAKTFTLP